MHSFSTDISLNHSYEQTNMTDAISVRQVMLGVTLYLMVIVTVLGNVMVIIAVRRERKLRTMFNYYIVNLAVTDLSVAVTAMSFYALNLIMGYWPFGEFMCGVWIFFDYGMTFASVFTLLVISIDRYWGVNWSLHYRNYHTKKKCISMIVVVWFVTAALWIPPCITDRMDHYTPLHCKWEPSENKGFAVVVAVIGHHGSFSVLLFCYTQVFIAMRKQSFIKTLKSVAQNANDDSVKSTDSDPSYPSIRPPTTETNTSPINYSKSSINRQEKHTENADNGVQPDSVVNNPIFEGDIKPISQNHSILSRSSHRRSSKRRRPSQIVIKLRSRERKVFRTLTFIITGYVVCWLPFHIVFDLSLALPGFVPEAVYALTFWMTYLNSTINPLLYNFGNPDFKRAFKRMLSYRSLHCHCRGTTRMRMKQKTENEYPVAT